MPPRKQNKRRRVVSADEDSQQSVTDTNSNGHCGHCNDKLQELSKFVDISLDGLDKECNALDHKMNIITKLIKENNDLMNKYKEKQRQIMKSLATDIGCHECEDIDDLTKEAKQKKERLEKDVKDLKRSLKSKKCMKTKYENKVKKLSEKLESLTEKKKELEENKDSKEFKDLAEIMRLRYKVSTTLGFVSFEWTDSGARKPKGVVTDHSNDISTDFWHSMNTFYKI